MTTTKIEIEKLGEWSPPREVNTSHGKRMLRKAKPTDEFRRLFGSSARPGPAQVELKAAGLGWGKDQKTGEWEVCWWQSALTPQQAAVQNAAIEASRATDAAVEIPVPAGLAYMPFQKAGIVSMRDRANNLLCDEQGLGKTVQAIGLINCDATIRKVLVVCPASLKVNWRNELARWMTRPLKVAVQSSKEAWAGDWADVVILNYDILGKFPQLFTTEWDLLVADEVHMAKNRNAKRTKLLLGASKKADKAQFPGVRAKRKVLMTGTPILNRPVEIFTLLDALQPGKWTFRDKIRYCAGFQGKWGWDFTGAAHLDELQIRLRSTCLTGDTQVYSEYGNIKISEIVSRKLSIRVWSRDRMGRLALRPIVGFSSKTHHGFLVKIRTTKGELVCTADHRIFTNKGEIRADEVMEGDYLCALPQEGGQKIGSMRSREAKNGQQNILFNVLRRQEQAGRAEIKIQKGDGVQAGEGSSQMRRLWSGILERDSFRKSKASVLHNSVQGKMAGKDFRGQEIHARSNQQAGIEASWMLLHDAGANRRACGKTSWKTKSKNIRRIKREKGVGYSKGELLARPTAKMGFDKSQSRIQTVSTFTSNAQEQFKQDKKHGTYKSSNVFGSQRTGFRRIDSLVGYRENICGYSDVKQVHHRSGRANTHQAIGKGNGQGEGQEIITTRVLRVEGVELGYSRTTGRRGKAVATVYDIEVEDTHNFFANGVLVHNCMTRRLKKDVLKDLPAKRRQVIELPTNGDAALVDEENDVYARREDEIISLKAQAEVAKLADDEAGYQAAVAALKKACQVAFTEIARVRHDVAVAKLDKVIEHVHNVLEETKKLVVFVHHHDVTDRLASEFIDFGVMVVDGRTENALRQEIVNQFNTDPAKRVLVLGIKAAGVGLSVKASVEIFAELDWTPGAIAQAEDRCHGIGRGIEGEPLLVQHLVLERSLDAKMAKTIVAKQNIADQALDKGAVAVQGVDPILTIEAGSILDDSTAAVVPVASEELRQFVHDGLRRLAGSDQDHAQALNGIGFNKMDGAFGHALAERGFLTDKMVVYAAKLCRKYSGQLGGQSYKDELNRLMGVKEAE